MFINFIKKLLNPLWSFVYKILDRILSLKKLTIAKKMETLEEYRSQILTKYNIKTIIDCGSGIGNYLSSINNIGSNYNIFCIDAYDLALEQLKLRFKDKKNYYYHNIGIWKENKNKELSLYPFPETNSFYGLNKNIVQSVKIRDKKLVSCSTIDSFISKNNIKNITLLHIDANGSEYQILSGSRNSLKQLLVKIVELETLLPNPYEVSNGISSCIAFLNKYGYTLEKVFIDPISHQMCKQTFFFHCK